MNKLNKIFIENNDVDIVLFNSIEIDNNKKLNTKENISVNDKITQKIIWSFENTFKIGNKFLICSYAYKKNIFLDSVCFNSLKLPNDDVYFNAYLLSKKLNAFWTNEIFYCYRINNINSVCWNSRKNNIFQTMKIYTKWFTSFPEWNIYNSQEAFDYLTYFCIYQSVGEMGGFRKAIKWSKIENTFFPSLKEIKIFLKKYKPYKGFKKIYFWLHLNVPICDYLLPLIYNWFCK
ncbi:hypothetical protein [Mycoplasmoides alvi]|uniref:hypothetical protein n=1 Tax=Mycoplasmoides alvi TaxID=78580 RepID=UPI00051C4569|nr:hypothetical protein [Mycoplasmoides alvi]